MYNSAPSASSSDPWIRLQQAARVVAEAPSRVDGHVARVEALIDLGLPTVARDDLDGLRRAGLDATIADQLHARIDAAPDDVFDDDAGDAIMHANLERLPRDVRPSDAEINAWRDTLRPLTWLRTFDGNVVRYNRANRRVGHLDNLRLVAERGVRDLNAHVASAIGGPIVVEGVDPPWILEGLIQAPPPDYPPGFQPRLIVVQKSIDELLCGLRTVDLGPGLDDPRIVWFVGDDAAAGLQSWLSDRSDCVAPTLAVRNPTLRAPLTPPASAVIQQFNEGLRTEAAAIAARLAARPARTAAHWADRYADAAAGGPPLRVFIPTSRYTTYLQHISEDLAAALRTLNCDVHIQIEPDNSSVLSSFAGLRMCERFDPELIIAVNYPRSEMHEDTPRDVPHVCWIQDAMTHLFSREVGDGFGPFDFAVGMVRRELIDSYGWPADRCAWMPMAASTAKFRRDPRTDADFDAEIAWVTHQSETPERFHRRFIADASELSPAAADALEDLYARILLAMEGPPSAFVFSALHAAIDASPYGRAHAVPGAPPNDLLLTTYVYPLAERIFRHETARWAASIARRRGWRLRLHGAGWDRHQDLAEFAAGPVDHGPALGACYRNAALQLHASLNQTLHQRVAECLFSGGQPAIRTARDAFAVMNDRALIAAVERGVGRPSPGDPDGLEVDIDDLPEAREMIERLRGLDLVGAEEFAGPTLQWPGFKVRDAQRTFRDAAQRDGARAFSALGDLFFTSEAQLERLVEDALNDPAARATRIARGVAQAPAAHTVEGFADQLLAFVRGRVTAAAEATDRDGATAPDPSRCSAHAAN